MDTSCHQYPRLVLESWNKGTWIGRPSYQRERSRNLVLDEHSSSESGGTTARHTFSVASPDLLRESDLPGRRLLDGDPPQ